VAVVQKVVEVVVQEGQVEAVLVEIVETELPEQSILEVAGEVLVMLIHLAQADQA
jgi:hypothetical protein